MHRTNPSPVLSQRLIEGVRGAGRGRALEPQHPGQAPSFVPVIRHRMRLALVVELRHMLDTAQNRYDSRSCVASPGST